MCHVVETAARKGEIGCIELDVVGCGRGTWCHDNHNLLVIMLYICVIAAATQPDALLRVTVAA